MTPEAGAGSDYRDFFAPRQVAVGQEPLHEGEPVPEADTAATEADAPMTAADQAQPDDGAVMAREADAPAKFPTGEPRVDDAISRLDDLAGLPVDEHVAVFDEVSRRLHDALAGLDS